MKCKHYDIDNATIIRWLQAKREPKKKISADLWMIFVGLLVLAGLFFLF